MVARAARRAARGAGGARLSVARAALGQGALDADARVHRRLDCAGADRARGGGAAAADAVEPAGRAARGRLLDPRRATRAATTRSASRSTRPTRWRRRCARERYGALEASALRAQGDRGDRRRRLRLRRRRRARAGERAPPRAWSAPTPSAHDRPAAARARARRAARRRSAAHAGAHARRRAAAARGAPRPGAPGGPPVDAGGRRRLSRALRAEERHAWQRLVRVLGHEINNSLAPIRSIAGSLRARVERTPPTTPSCDADLGERARA